MHRLPVFYCRSSIMMLDDDVLFMKALSQLLESKRSVRAFSNPSDCLLAYKEKNDENICNQILKYDDSSFVGDAVINVSLQKISALENHVLQQNAVSVIIVDYHMPDMNGIDFCRELNGYPVKKILLTGAASIDEAINALNEGIIDCYLTKGDGSMVDNLNKYVALLESKYYLDLTAPLMSCLEAGSPLPLTDASFIDKLNQFIFENDIVSYALIDRNGSLILRDVNEKPYYLIVHTQRSLSEFIKLNDDVPDAENYLALVEKKEKIPFFGIGRECWEFQVDEWHQHFYSAETLDGRERYYYAFLT